MNSKTSRSCSSVFPDSHSRVIFVCSDIIVISSFKIHMYSDSLTIDVKMDPAGILLFELFGIESNLITTEACTGKVSCISQNVKPLSFDL